MPQAAVVAAIPAAAAVGSAVIQHRGQRQGARDQQNATRQALELEERRRQEIERKRQEAANAREFRFMNYYNRYGEDAIRRYGIPSGIDPGLFPNVSTTPTGGRPARTAGPATQPTAQPIGRGLFDSQQPGGTGQIRGDVFDWERYL